MGIIGSNRFNFKKNKSPLSKSALINKNSAKLPPIVNRNNENNKNLY